MAALITGLLGLSLITSSSAVSIPSYNSWESGSWGHSHGQGQSQGHQSQSSSSGLCDNVWTGYQCETNISHYWGQYAPYFAVASDIPNEVPQGCSVTFAQILSRHGARNPTTSKTALYNSTILQIKKNVKASSYVGKYAFLANYTYTLGANDLTTFGQQEMVNSGIKYYERYEALTRDHVPFVRSTSEARVVESAQNWTQGFASAKSEDRSATGGDPSVNVIILEATTSNNTLNHETCYDFENGWYSTIASSAQKTWASVFITPIMNRLNTDLPGANLTQIETVYMMDLCPFNTVYSTTGEISDFCALFTETEWQQYGYYESLNKFYGYGAGNPLGPTQGTGWTNELIARLTNTSVEDTSSINSTLDSSSTTFPLGLPLYADFSHDDDLTGIFYAMGLYNQTALLSNTTLETTNQTHGYSAAWTVPFAARAYFEKMTCPGQSEELLRVIVNDRVIPLQNCGADSLGRCKLSNWVASQSFSREGGHWGQCFV